jgi:hypothetical protein
MILLGCLFALGLFDLVYSFTGAYSKFGILYPAAHALLNIILFLALSFIWSKEKWAAWLFLGIVVAHMGLDLAVGAFQFFKLFLFLPVIYFLIKLK